MSPLLIDSGVDTAADLAALLPGDVRERIDPVLLHGAPTAAALRVLATVRDTRWRHYVYAARIDWTPMLAWVREPYEPLDDTGASSSVCVRVEAAASLAGAVAARPDLLRAATGLDEGNFRALLDALRIARNGLRP